jgi:shikimate kinase
MTPRVVLVGMPGTGKTTTGRRLAKILAVPFADSDVLVERRTGRTVADVFAESGEPEFRDLEAAAIRSALTDFDGVLALGGGAVTDVGTQRALAEAGVPVVLLRADLSTLAARVGDGHVRPLLAGDTAERLTQLSAEREAAYTACATLTVHTDRRTPGQVAAQIAARLHEVSATTHE